MKKIEYLLFTIIISSFFISCATTIESVKTEKKDSDFLLQKKFKCLLHQKNITPEKRYFKTI